MKYNMVYSAALAPLFVLGSLAQAVAVPAGDIHEPNWGNAIVKNNCGSSAYYILDNGNGNGASKIAAGGQMSVPIYKKGSDNGGMSIKLFTNPNTNVWGGDAVTQFEITATDLEYFDVSNVNSNIGNGMNGNGQPCTQFPPFMQGGLAVTGNGIPGLSCSPGANPCKSAYSQNDDNFATSAIALGQDLTLTLCPNGGSSSGSSGSQSSGQQQQQQQQPANPPPSTSSAPAPAANTQPVGAAAAKEKDASTPTDSTPSPAQDEEVVWVTHVVTAAPAVKVVHVDAKAKRDEHIHMHAHQNVHKRRLAM